MQKRTSAITKIATTMSAFALVLILAVPTFANAAVINGTTVAGSQLTITGTGFSETPLTVTFDGQKLAVVSDTPTQIVATLATMPAPGSYRLVVKAGKASTFAYIVVPSSPATVQAAALNQNQSNDTFTPTTDGVFRISYYATSAAGLQNPSYFNLNWTDEFGPHVIQDVLSTPPTFYEGEHRVHSLAAQPISYGLAASPGNSFNLYVTVEQIQ